MLTIPSTNSTPLYAEDFGVSATNLNAVTPVVTVSDAQWTAPASTLAFLANGSLTNATAATAWLPLVPKSGVRYTLTTQIAQGGTDTNSWDAFGFLRNPPNTGAIHSGATATGIIWALTRNDSGNANQVLHENVNGGTGLVASGDFVIGAATVTMSLVLDTTGGTGHWNYDRIVNGTVVTNRALSASFESVIGGIGIAKHGSISPHAFKTFGLTQQ